MRSYLQRSLAAMLIGALLCGSVPGCSKPMDPQSDIPAEYQPIVFAAAAVGIGIYIASKNHKSNSSSGGGGTTQTLTAPFFVGPLGNQPFDIALDLSTAGSGGVGALGRNGGGGNYGFVEIGSSTGADNGAYALPVGYKPSAVAIDGSGNDWFVNSTGLVKKCPAAVAGVTTCSPLLSFSDGLPTSGIRSIAADSVYVFIAQDNLAGTVSFVAFNLAGGGRVSGSYTYSGLSMYNADAAVATIGSVGLYTIFHKDGTSWKISLPTSSKNPYTFTPTPLASQNMASDGLGNNYGFLGAPTSGSYQIGHYVSTGNSVAAPGTLVSTITVAFNGQTSPNAAPFVPPLSSAKTDDVYIFFLDSSGNLVLFSVF